MNYKYRLLKTRQLVFNTFLLSLCVSVSANTASFAVNPVTADTPVSPDDMLIRGSARYNTLNEETEAAYVPSNPAVVNADRLAADYKLGAAEQAYRALADQIDTRAEGVNGLGKVLYYKTASSANWVRADKAESMELAKQYFLEATLLNPRYAEAWLNLGQIQLDMNDQLGAQESLNRLSNLQPLPPNLASRLEEKLGQLALMQDDVALGLPHLQRAVALDASNASAYFHLSNAYLKRGEYQSSHQFLQRAIHLSPNIGVFYEQLGAIYEATGNDAAAIAAYQKALELKPESQVASDHLVNQYAERGDYELAIAQLKTALAATTPGESNRQASLSLRIGNLALKAGQPETAKRYFQFAQKSQDPDQRRKADKGLSEAELKITKNLYPETAYSSEAAYEARNTVSRSLTANPDNFKAQQLRMEINARQKFDTLKEISYSQANYQNAMNHTATSRGELLAQGEMLLDRYQFKDADQKFELAIQAVSTPEDAVRLGDMLLTLGVPDIASEAYHRATSLGAPEEMVMIGLDKTTRIQRQAAEKIALANLAFKKSEKSLEGAGLLQESLKMNQRNPEIHYRLGRYYQETKNNDRAMDHYYAYLQLSPQGGKSKDVNKAMAKLVSAD